MRLIIIAGLRMPSRDVISTMVEVLVLICTGVHVKALLFVARRR